MKSKKFEVNPLKGNIFAGMLLFSVPIILVQLLQVLFQATDTIVIANFGEEGAMSSVGVTSSLINLIISGALGLSAGVSVVLGQAFGKGDYKKVHEVVHNITLTALIIGAVIAAISIPLARVLLTFMKVPDSLMENAVLYFRIYFLGVPFNIAFNFMTAAVQSKGDTLHPLIYQLIGGVINLLLNLLTVIVFKWNVAGVAIATVISQMFCAGGIFIHLCNRDDELKIHIKEMRAFHYLSQVFIIGIPSSIGWIVMDISNVLISRSINTFNEIVIEGSTASASIEGFMYIAFAGFSSACVVYISQNYGAKQYDRIKETFIITGLAVFTLGELIGGTIYLVGRPLLHIYTRNEEAIDAGMIRLFYMGVFFGLCGTMNSLNGCVRGLGCSKASMAVQIIWAGVFRVTWVLLMNKYVHTVASIFVAYPICWIGSTTSSIIAFIICYRLKVGAAMMEVTDVKNKEESCAIEEINA